jgi:pilus assembly protein CpaB
MRLIIVIVALVVALMIAFAASGVFKKEEVNKEFTPAQFIQPAKVEEVDIYVASEDVEIGEVIEDSDFEVKRWPKSLLPPYPIYASEGKKALTGQVANGPIVKGEPLLKSKFRNPNDPSFLAGQLAEGMRAISVSVNLTSSVAGFVAPGDLVDVIYTFDIAKDAVEAGDITPVEGKDIERVSISETLLTAVKILAVDSRVSARIADPNNKENRAIIPASVTLAVNQKDAQKLRLAEKTGALTMVLRSLEDKENFNMPRPIAEQDLTRIMPPAYFPLLFDDSTGYDSRLVNIYAGAKKDDGEPESEERVDPFLNINVYRGTEKNVVEVLKNDK